jgi:single-strand DNA-binding protein
MAGSNINRVILTGNLTKDPELRAVGSSGNQVCELRVACNGRRRDASGNWVDKPNYFDVSVWGPQGENCARFLAKGRGVAIDGRLDWREWTDKESGKNRQHVGIIADSVQFIGGRGDGPPPTQPAGGFSPSQSDVPVSTSDFAAPAASATSDDDIPF